MQSIIVSGLALEINKLLGLLHQTAGSIMIKFKLLNAMSSEMLLKISEEPSGKMSDILGFMRSSCNLNSPDRCCCELRRGEAIIPFANAFFHGSA